MVGSWGAFVSSGMSLSLKASFYAIDTPLVTATIVATISQKAKTIALARLKTRLDCAQRFFSVAQQHDVFAFVLIEILKELMVWMQALSGCLHTRKAGRHDIRDEVLIRTKGLLRFLFKSWNVELETKRVFMKNKEFWKTVIQIIVTVLTALMTTLGVSACAL